MPTTIPLGVLKQAFMYLTEDGVKIPSSFDNIVCTTGDLAIFGFVAPGPSNILNIGIVGAGNTSLLVEADCTYNSPETGSLTTQRRSKSLSVSVVSQGNDFLVTFE